MKENLSVPLFCLLLSGYIKGGLKLEERLRMMMWNRVMEALNPVLQEAFLLGSDLLVTDKKPIASSCAGFSCARNPYGASSIMIADERSIVIVSQQEDGTFLIHDFVKILDYHRFYETLIPQHTRLYEKVSEILEELGETEEIFYTKLVP